MQLQDMNPDDALVDLRYCSEAKGMVSLEPVLAPVVWDGGNSSNRYIHIYINSLISEVFLVNYDAL